MKDVKVVTAAINGPVSTKFNDGHTVSASFNASLKIKEEKVAQAVLNDLERMLGPVHKYIGALLADA